MKIMVIGGGGREHALIRKIKENPDVQKIYALPGNGGIAADAECVPIGAKDIEAITAFARSHGVDFAVVAPDDPLVLGAVDALEAMGIPCFGPSARAAEIEGSKVFSKMLMEKYGIPTASSRIFSDAKEAREYLRTSEYPIVIKADGLALGKGVFIAESRQDAMEAIAAIMEEKVFGDSGNRVVVEECLTGPEVSVLAFTDGETMIPMVSSMDHKRAQTGDLGPNTGGMGAIAPNPFYTQEIADRCMEEIFLPTMKAMNSEDRPFRGCLYFGLMLTDNGPKVIEYNCRFGDPETQVVLPLLESDLLDILVHVSRETLAQADVRFSAGSSCCVIMASAGYPIKHETGFEINIPSGLPAQVYAAGVRTENGKLLTAGGRVLGVTAVGQDLAQAVSRAYEAVEQIRFENAYYRTDIGKKALAGGEQ
ncbi:MAG TPA: phosphoribosylamine--glycine ligase [Clostridiales bacterium]|nr:phosphoribosylamine--glycine ligase [Clostridiales bacterium]